MFIQWYIREAGCIMHPAAIAASRLSVFRLYFLLKRMSIAPRWRSQHKCSPCFALFSVSWPCNSCCRMLLSIRARNICVLPSCGWRASRNRVYGWASNSISKPLTTPVVVEIGDIRCKIPCHYISNQLCLRCPEFAAWRFVVTYARCLQSLFCATISHFIARRHWHAFSLKNRHLP